MSDGSDGAGGVGGGSGGNSGTSGAESAADSLGAAAESLSESLSSAISDALSGLADSVGLSDALGGLANALGIDAKDLQGILGAAVVGFATGGLPGAIMGVANGLVGGSLTEAARDAISANLPAGFQQAANLALDAFSGRMPGAGMSLQSAIDTLASGALTNGRAPGIGELGAVARSLSEVTTAARSAIESATRGDFASAADAVASLEGSLQSQLDAARNVTASVAGAVANGHGVHPSDRTGFEGRVEQLAIDTARVLLNR
ncbi:hypothetical protein LDO32_10455 [Luteimonas sp. Y-2-2-4F]|nr:hypothetical protein [Luteimonas sp. Y-2-2-4F]MCD9032143.1 hypothetical protein [Luteimonas sp. Y-2-2-4F]